MNNNNNRLFVAGLPFSASEDEIRNFFSSVGNVKSVSIIFDRMTNRSKGFGFVEMEKIEDAKTAVDKLHDKEFGGRKLVVAFAKPQERREFKSRNNDRRGGFNSERRPSFGGSRGRSSGFGDKRRSSFGRSSDRGNNRSLTSSAGRSGGFKRGR